ncbi:MAG: hypothetical protein ACYDBQ_04485, partial [Thermoplasmatota archaeon]
PKGAVVYVNENIPAGCASSFTPAGQSVSMGSPVRGQRYGSGTSFDMGCNATNPAGTGNITLMPA